jgi:hypothetical protein
VDSRDLEAVPAAAADRARSRAAGGKLRGAAAMRLAGHPSKAAANRQPDALLAELERTRAEFERAERAARTYLVGQGVLDQTQVDLVAALKRSDRKAE